jgi:hypothetical protein
VVGRVALREEDRLSFVRALVTRAILRRPHGVRCPVAVGVDYNAHVIESILKCVAPELGWR